MSYSFEYIDIILLAMIAGFIFLRLRGILGKRSGFEGKAPTQLREIIKNVNPENNIKKSQEFDDLAKKEFLNGAKIAYETIITDFSDNDNKLIASKPLLSKKIYDDFNKALKDRSDRGHYAEITFIGIKSADIKEHKKIDKAIQCYAIDTVEIIGHTDKSPNTGMSNMDKYPSLKKLSSGFKKVYAGSNTDLGLLRAVSVRTLLQEQIGDKHLGLQFRAYSASSLIDPDSKQGGNLDREKRRIEIRLTRRSEESTINRC